MHEEGDRGGRCIPSGVPGGAGYARAAPAPCPHHARATPSQNPRHARAMPAPRPRQCPVPPGAGAHRCTPTLAMLTTASVWGRWCGARRHQFPAACKVPHTGGAPEPHGRRSRAARAALPSSTGGAPEQHGRRSRAARAALPSSTGAMVLTASMVPQWCDSVSYVESEILNNGNGPAQGTVEAKQRAPKFRPIYIGVIPPPCFAAAGRFSREGGIVTNSALMHSLNLGVQGTVRGCRQMSDAPLAYPECGSASGPRLEARGSVWGRPGPSCDWWHWTNMMHSLYKAGH
eukprot:gene13243-biopygen5011